MASRRALLNRLKKLELRQGKSTLGQWLIMGIRGQKEAESDQDYEAFCAAARADIRETTGWDGLILEVPKGFERDPRDPPVPDAVYDKGYTYDGDPDLGGWLVG